MARIVALAMIYPALAALLGAFSWRPALALTLPTAPGIEVFTPDDVLRDYTAELPTGDLAFRESNGALVRLIVSIEDPEILNRGDGAFHPANQAAVVQSLQEIPPAYVQPLQVEIYLLPYPRSGRLSSSADSRAIYLSPGVREYGDAQVAFLVTHEIGHSFHRHFMPDSSTDLWTEWAELRGVDDASIFNEDAEHAYRPHEIFAEDFRVLFGGSAARGAGGIENPEILSPELIPGLREFYEGLAGNRSLPAVVVGGASPNPIRAGQLLTLRLPRGDAAAAGALSAQLVNVSGRVVAHLEFLPAGGSAYTAALAGNAFGDRLPPGAYWLRVTSAPRRVPRVVPIRIVP